METLPLHIHDRGLALRRKEESRGRRPAWVRPVQLAGGMIRLDHDRRFEAGGCDVAELDPRARIYADSDSAQHAHGDRDTQWSSHAHPAIIRGVADVDLQSNHQIVVERHHAYERAE